MTPEIQEASWKYAYQSQIILNGTFRVCDKKILLFIIMGPDENKKFKGVSLAFLLFSAPLGNQHSAAGYNTKIITRLVDKWKKSLRTQNEKEFEAWVLPSQ